MEWTETEPRHLCLFVQCQNLWCVSKFISPVGFVGCNSPSDLVLSWWCGSLQPKGLLFPPVLWTLKCTHYTHHNDTSSTEWPYWRQRQECYPCSADGQIRFMTRAKLKQSALPNQVLVSGTKSKLGTVWSPVLIDLTCAACPSWLDDMSLGDALSQCLPSVLCGIQVRRSYSSSPWCVQ